MQLHVGGIGGISCQHLQVLMTQVLHQHWKLQEVRRTDVWHGSERRPAMYVRQHGHRDGPLTRRGRNTVRNLWGDQNVHGWIVAALLREVALEGQATFENAERTFLFTRCIRQGSVEAPRLWLKMATQISSSVAEDWKKRKMGLHMETFQGGFHQLGSFTWADKYWILSKSEEHLEQMMKEFVEDAK